MAPLSGAGFSLAMACDYVCATPDARFCSAFARLNLMPDMGLLHTLERRVGSWQARRIIMTSMMLEANPALALGVVDEVVEPERLEEAAMRSAGQYAALAPGAFAMVKSAFASGATASLDEVLRLETDGQAALRGTVEHHAAVSAFLDKQKSRGLRQAENAERNTQDGP
jgi:2-(1,2-epoxy-1,2-dihydrophenyl)acetyl-CoA isomerase